MKPRVLLADDHVVLLDAIRNLLAGTMDVVGTIAHAARLEDAVAALHPDVVVMDLSMPGGGGVKGIARLREAYPPARIVVLTMHEDRHTAAEAFASGACAYLVKSNSAQELLAAIDRVLRGERVLTERIAGGVLARLHATARRDGRLTAREEEVVRLIARGLTMRQIGAALGITPRTVAFHKYRAMEALGAGSNAELIAFVLDAERRDAPQS